MDKRKSLKMKKASLVLFVALLAAGASLLMAAPSDLDRSFAGFGTDGKVITSQPNN